VEADLAIASSFNDSAANDAAAAYNAFVLLGVLGVIGGAKSNNPSGSFLNKVRQPLTH
jgi:hypothetical protein